MGVGAVCSFAALLVLAVGAAWSARRIDHEVRRTGAAVERLRLVNRALDQLRGEAARTRAAVDETGDSVAVRGRR